MSIINFTVQHDHRAASPDFTDEDSDLDLLPLVGWVTFSPDPTQFLIGDYAPRPTGVNLLKFIGYIGLDGRLRATQGGPLGVRLPANDPAFNQNILRYRVDFHLRTPAGQPVPVTSGYFDAPSTDSTIWLAQALTGDTTPVDPNQAVVDGGFPSSTFADLVDAGAPSSSSVDLIDGGIA